MSEDDYAIEILEKERDFLKERLDRYYHKPVPVSKEIIQLESALKKLKLICDLSKVGTWKSPNSKPPSKG